MADHVLREVEGPVAVLTLNRPEARNALSDEMRESLLKELEALNAESEVRVVVLTGAGSAFCAGGGIKSMPRRLTPTPGQAAVPRPPRPHPIPAFIQGLIRAPQIVNAT